MKRALKIVSLMVLLVCIAAQFYQPALNVNKGQANVTNFTDIYDMPKALGLILKTSCYDCHSNRTNYVWYDYIQPVRTLVERHIKAAKEDLNFDEWNTYSKRKKERLLNSIKEQVQTYKMPLPSYIMMHKNAKLDDQQIKLLTNWLREKEVLLLKDVVK